MEDVRINKLKKLGYSTDVPNDTGYYMLAELKERIIYKMQYFENGEYKGVVDNYNPEKSLSKLYLKIPTC